MRRWRAAALVVVGLVAGLLYANFLFSTTLPGDRGWKPVVSEMEVPGTQHALVLRVADVVCALLVLILLPFVRAALPAGRSRTWAIAWTAVFAVGNGVAGIVTLPGHGAAHDELQRWVHNTASIVSAGAVFLGALVIARATGEAEPRWVHTAAWLTFWVGGVVGTTALGIASFVDDSSWEAGIAQRFQILVTSGWLVCLGVLAASATQRPPVTDDSSVSPPA